MSDFHVLMVLYKENFGDIARVQLSMTDIKFIDEYLKYTFRYPDETANEDSIVWRKTKEFEHFLSECLRTETEHNRLEK